MGGTAFARVDAERLGPIPARCRLSTLGPGAPSVARPTTPATGVRELRFWPRSRCAWSAGRSSLTRPTTSRRRPPPPRSGLGVLSSAPSVLAVQRPGIRRVAGREHEFGGRVRLASTSTCTRSRRRRGHGESGVRDRTGSSSSGCSAAMRSGSGVRSRTGGDDLRPHPPALLGRRPGPHAFDARLAQRECQTPGPNWTGPAHSARQNHFSTTSPLSGKNQPAACPDKAPALISRGGPARANPSLSFCAPAHGEALADRVRHADQKRDAHPPEVARHVVGLSVPPASGTVGAVADRGVYAHIHGFDTPRDLVRLRKLPWFWIAAVLHSRSLYSSLSWCSLQDVRSENERHEVLTSSRQKTTSGQRCSLLLWARSSSSPHCSRGVIFK